MHKSKKIIVFGLIASVLCGGITFWGVNAQSAPLSQAQLEQIQGNCIAVKSTLNQIHSSDALLRVNTGQTYESISTKLMKRFDDRAYFNNMNNDTLVASSANFDILLNNFRNDYLAYEQKLSSAISIDCVAQPEAFYNAVALARSDRVKVHDDVTNLDNELDQYNLALAKFETDNKDRIGELSK